MYLVKQFRKEKVSGNTVLFVGHLRDLDAFKEQIVIYLLSCHYQSICHYISWSSAYSGTQKGDF